MLDLFLFKNCKCGACEDIVRACCSCACFPSTGTVKLDNGKSLSMSELQNGDLVETGTARKHSSRMGNAHLLLPSWTKWQMTVKTLPYRNFCLQLVIIAFNLQCLSWWWLVEHTFFRRSFYTYATFFCSIPLKHTYWESKSQKCA